MFSPHKFNPHTMMVKGGFVEGIWRARFGNEYERIAFVVPPSGGQNFFAG
jgi:hypothetical protein